MHTDIATTPISNKKYRPRLVKNASRAALPTNGWVHTKTHQQIGRKVRSPAIRGQNNVNR
jgi:hypothetical protein